MADDAESELARLWIVPQVAIRALHHDLYFFARSRRQLLGRLGLQHDQAVGARQRLARFGGLVDIAVHVGAGQRQHQGLILRKNHD
jgi:hypothetical protein